MPSFNITRNIIDVNGQYFEVKKTFKEENVKDPVGLKEFLGYDVLFKKDGLLYFCNAIVEPEYVDLPYEQTNNTN
jgi:hypothetical protein